MPTKTVYYDVRSILIKEGDTVQVTLRTLSGVEETFEATYMGTHQIEAYTTPYFIFCIDNHVRFINANDVREITFDITSPLIPSSHQLEDRRSDYDPH